MKTDNSMEPRPSWAFALGLVMVVLGITAIAAPIFTSLAIELVLGWLFILGGLLHVIYISAAAGRVIVPQSADWHRRLDHWPSGADQSLGGGHFADAADWRLLFSRRRFSRLFSLSAQAHRVLGMALV